MKSYVWVPVMWSTALYNQHKFPYTLKTFQNALLISMLSYRTSRSLSTKTKLNTKKTRLWGKDGGVKIQVEEMYSVIAQYKTHT